MDLERFRKRVLAAEADLAPAPPSPCRDCANLVRMRTPAGAFALSCLLERAGTQMGGPPDRRAENGPTAQWIRRALFTPANELVDIAGEDRDAVVLLGRAEAANGTCPIMERLEGWLPGAPRDAVADLEPPQPIHGYGALRVALGLDKPSTPA